MGVILHNPEESGVIPEKGDVRITTQMNRKGMRHMRGGHCNYGYSGSVLVFVYDGGLWAWLRKKDKPDLPRSFDFQYQSDELLGRYKQYFENFSEDLEFSFWWYDGKRFAKISRGEQEPLERKILEEPRQMPLTLDQGTVSLGQALRELYLRNLKGDEK
tara:strand:+ start:280 stop:756 length:477 start_codon:yes stop_codon:yes gene_type:complete